MSDGISEKLDEIIRYFLPYGLMLLLFLLNVISFYTPLSIKIEFPFILMVLYYWAVYRPTLIPPLLVFCMGLCFDMLSDLPLGLSSFVFLIVRHVVTEQRVFLTGQPFTVIWLGYMIVSFCALGVQWILFGLTQFHWTPALSVSLMGISGIFIYPVISLILSMANKVLPVIHDQYTAVR